MRATFLGHGLYSDNNKNNVGKQLAKSFESKYFDNFIGFVAFAAVSGVDTILSKILKAKHQYKTLRFYIGVDNKGTSKEALELLLKEDIETYIYHKKEKYITYHPKLFLFEGEKLSRVIIGSSNLTNSGFKTNIEASIQLDFRNDTDKQGLKLVNEIKEYYKDLIDLSDKNLTKLDRALIDELESENLLYSQFHGGSNQGETQPTDGENDNDTVDKSETSDFDINSGFDPIDNEPRNRNVRFSSNDSENFEFFFERYKVYKRDIRPSGVVYKGTQDRELFSWYGRIKDLINNDELPDDLLQKLSDAGFPIGNGWEKRSLEIWNKKFEELKEYKAKFNPNSEVTHVPQFRDKNNKYYSLGTWCAGQKQRRKGNYKPAWTQYEEDMMNSIKFLWDPQNLGSRLRDDDWADNLVELEEYYLSPDNYKSIPHQNTRIGKWLNEQITLKLTGTRGKTKKFLNPLREEMLGDLLKRNGVEWKWQEQKEREAVERLAEEWIKNKVQMNYSSLSENDRKKFNDNIAGAKNRSKTWPDWKRNILLNVGIVLPPKTNENNDE